MSDSLRTPRIAITGMWSNGIHGLRFDGSAVASAVLRSVIRAGGEPVTLFAESLLPAGRSSELVRLVHPVGTQFRRPGTVARFRVF